jgi:hypothetical protein
MPMILPEKTIKKPFDFWKESVVYSLSLSEQRKRKSGFRVRTLFFAQGGKNIGTYQ